MSLATLMWHHSECSGDEASLFWIVGETPKLDSHWEDWVRSGRRSGFKPSELLRGSTVLRRINPKGGTGHRVSSDSVEPGDRGS